MRVFHGFDALPHFVRPTVTVGSYDGVHLGHRALIGRLIAEASANGGESVVLTFEPHPRITLGRAEGLRLLTTLDEKTALLEELGVDNVIVIPFDRAFSALSGEEFVNDYLIGPGRRRNARRGLQPPFRPRPDRLRHARGVGTAPRREGGTVHRRWTARQFDVDPPVAGGGKDRGGRPPNRRRLKKPVLGQPPA